MTKVIGVRFRTAGKIYFFAPGKFEIKRDDHVIVETARVLDCPNHLMKKIVDKFGEDFEVERISEDRFQATVSANVSKTFFGWVCTYAGEIKLVGPEDVVKAYRKHLRKALK